MKNYTYYYIKKLSSIHIRTSLFREKLYNVIKKERKKELFITEHSSSYILFSSHGKVFSKTKQKRKLVDKIFFWFNSLCKIFK